LKKTILASLAGEHLQQAIQDTEKAARWAEDPNHDSSFVEQVDNALDNAIQAQKEEPNPHIKKGISLLRRAKKVAGGSHMRSFELRGAKIAMQALHQFQAVK
jgi:SPX domain protein involved in polyphosphate accumulation